MKNRKSQTPKCSGPTGRSFLKKKVVFDVFEFGLWGLEVVGFWALEVGVWTVGFGIPNSKQLRLRARGTWFWQFAMGLGLILEFGNWGLEFRFTTSDANDCW